MNIIIFGSNGMLGNYIKSFLKEYNIISLTRKEYDIMELNTLSLEKLLNNYNINKNTIIINCAGVIPQRNNNNNTNNKKYILVNTLFPILLSNICKTYNSKFIHITTDCVFSGIKGLYKEKDEKDENNIYGITKNLGELCDGTIIRTSIIGEEINNKKSLLEWVIKQKGKIINGYNNHYWNGITCLELSKIIKKIIKTNNFWKGIRHIYSPNITSKYELVSIINEIYKLNITINKYNTEKTINKTLSTIYNTNQTFNIPNLKIQIQELYKYNITEIQII